MLELLDGAYFDNSGGWVAIDLLDDLERYLSPPSWARRRKGAEYEAFKEVADDIRFHLMRFTDRPAQRKGAAKEDERFELLTPLIAFNTVRSAPWCPAPGRTRPRPHAGYLLLSLRSVVHALAQLAAFGRYQGQDRAAQQREIQGRRGALLRHEAGAAAARTGKTGAPVAEG